LAGPKSAYYNGAVLPASTDSLAPGVSFGSYVVRELIGRGGMASVYRAEHLLLAKPVALKVMERSLLSTAGSRQRFVLEGRAAAAIKHPNIVDITDVGVHEDVPFLVMELLTGEDLDVHLKRQGPLDEASTVRLALPIITALHAAHGRGVIHRDIKPSNIFLSQGPDDQIVPKVLDFGISKVMSEGASELSLTPHHQVMGTPRYLPPEALQSPRDLGPASDQFSLGVVLYECVTGSTPYSGDSLIALLNALSVGAFTPPRTLAPDISPGLDRVIMRALSLQPSDRFPTIRDMGRALLELAAERTQMVWGHSFKVPGTDVAPSSRGRMAAVTQPLEPPSVFARHRRLVFGACFIGIGALASALGTAFLHSSGGTRDRAPEASKQEPTVSVAAALPAPVEPPVRPVAASTESAPTEKSAKEADVAGASGERGRTSRNPGRRPKSGPARRAKTASATSESAQPDEPADVSPVEGTAAGVSPAAPAATPAPNTSVRGPGPTRRQGANNSPLLD
jgi:serine/threonine-protein kinase